MQPIKILAAIATALLATASASPVCAKSPLPDILNKGSRWALNVDGQEGTMTLLGGNGQQTPDGGWTMEMEVEWRGYRGTISARADAKNLNQRVILNLNQGGVSVNCGGFVAQCTGILMAGTTCYRAVGGDQLGAWFAVKLTDGARRELRGTSLLRPASLGKREQSSEAASWSRGK